MSEISLLRVLFLTLYPETMPSSRLRVFQYLPYLKESGIEATVLPALPEPWFSRFYFSNSRWTHLVQFGAEALVGLGRVLQGRNYDVVFIQKGILSTNLRGFDRLLGRSVPLIFDLDDLMYGRSHTEFRSPLLRWAQDPDQTKKISSRARAVIVGNQFLKEKALRYNPNVFVIPTPVDTDRFAPQEKPVRKNSKEIVIGWIGMETTLPYLFPLQEVFLELSRLFSIRLKLVTRTGRLKHPFQGYPVEIVPWSYQTEVREMADFDIGVMPLPQERWSEGKCGLKLLQYMAMGLPSVASATGANRDIVDDGQDGFLASRPQEWIDKLSRLIENPGVGKKMGERARRKAVENYSLEKSSEKLINVLKAVSERHPEGQRPEGSTRSFAASALNPPVPLRAT